MVNLTQNMVVLCYLLPASSCLTSHSPRTSCARDARAVLEYKVAEVRILFIYATEHEQSNHHIAENAIRLESDFFLLNSVHWIIPISRERKKMFISSVRFLSVFLIKTGPVPNTFNLF
jgi:hypothetical protein